MADRSRRKQILEAARVLFRAKGYHATTIRDIADEAGMLSGSLYAHIKSKEDLLYEITDEVAQQFLTSLKTVSDLDVSPQERLRLGLSAHLKVVSLHLDAASVFMHEWRGLSDERRADIQAKRDEYEGLWKSILADGVEKGVFRAENLRYARMVLLSVANWSYQWFDPEGALTPDEVATRLADVLLCGLEK